MFWPIGPIPTIHGALAREISRRALSQPGLPGMAALSVGQQREAPVDRYHGAQGAVRYGNTPWRPRPSSP